MIVDTCGKEEEFFLTTVRIDEIVSRLTIQIFLMVNLGNIYKDLVFCDENFVFRLNCMQVIL